MQINFQYQKPAVINALRFHFLNRGEIRVFSYVLIILFVFAVGGYWIDIVSFQAVVAIVLMIVLLLLVFWYLLPASIYRKAATFRESIRLQYNEEGMVIGTHVGERHINWTNFNNVVETQDFFYLYRDKKSFFLIPTNAFQDDADKLTFSHMLQQKFDHYVLKR